MLDMINKGSHHSLVYDNENWIEPKHPRKGD